MEGQQSNVEKKEEQKEAQKEYHENITDEKELKALEQFKNCIATKKKKIR